MEYRLRKAAKEDWSFIWSLRVTTMKDQINDTYGWEENTQKSYAQESLHGEIVLIDEMPVGVTTLADWGDQLHLVWIAILPARQGLGLGKALVKYCQQQASARNKPLSLQVLRNNPALWLYEKQGFEIYDQNGPYKLLMRWQPNFT
ncbi:MAG: GNAT family N-acetyltransferase [Cyanobacteria bacterium P01_A01_bin.17]